MNLTNRVLSFWFAKPDSSESESRPDQWFKVDSDFDREIRDLFLDDYEAAAAGGMSDMAESADGSLALTILLDQFPRNIFRGDPRAFATGAAALDVSRRSIERGFDLGMPPEKRQFLYLPYQHCESLSYQERSVELFGRLNYRDCLEFAVRHRDIIARFGRFPHRNAMLGRKSTAEELEFLKQPGSSF